MGTWDYRVVRKREGNEFTYGVHEVFFDDEGRVWQCTEDPLVPLGNTMTELRKIFIGFVGALFDADEGHGPDCGCIVDYDLIPQEGAKGLLPDLSKLEADNITVLDWTEIRAKWLEAAKDCCCSTCVYWRPAPLSRVLDSGRCVARPLGVMDKEFNKSKRYARTRRADWCNVWVQRKL